MEPQGHSYQCTCHPLLLAFFLQNLKTITTNVEHPYGILYLHNVVYSFVLVISENDSPRYIHIITLQWWMKKHSHVEGLGHTARAGHSTSTIPPLLSNLLYTAWLDSFSYAWGGWPAVVDSLPSLPYLWIWLLHGTAENPGQGGDGEWSTDSPSSRSWGHRRIAGVLDRKSPFLSRSWLSPWDDYKGSLPLPFQA